MPDSIPKPVQQAAAAIIRRINASPTSPSIEEIAALIDQSAGGGGGLVLTIDGVAQKIARLWVDYDALDKANSDDRLRNAAHAHVRVLEQLLLQLEPQNEDEALSLLLLTEELFQRWAADAYRDQDLTTEAEREWDAMTRAFAELTRWLLNNGAESPLLPTYFRKKDRRPLAEQIESAIAQARELPACREEMLP